MKARERVLFAVIDRALAALLACPQLVKCLGRPVVTRPWLGGRMKVLTRAFLGATAFEAHDVDLERGRISIGGVEEVMFGSKIIELLHSAIEGAMDEAASKDALYRFGQELCQWEVTQALESGRWGPKLLNPLIRSGELFDLARTDPTVNRIMLRIIEMMSRLITDEGGWGHLDFELTPSTFRVFLRNSQEARWLGPSERPVCHLYTGIVAGYASTIAGRPLRAREVECAAMGAPACVFEVDEDGLIPVD